MSRQYSPPTADLLINLPYVNWDSSLRPFFMPEIQPQGEDAYVRIQWPNNNSSYLVDLKTYGIKIHVYEHLTAVVIYVPKPTYALMCAYFDNGGYGDMSLGEFLKKAGAEYI